MSFFSDVFKADKANLDLQGLEMSPEGRAESEVLGWKCFICDAQLTTETSYSVFYTMLSQSGVLLSNALNKALKTSYVTPHSMRSPVVCNR